MSWTPWTEGSKTPGGSQVARLDERDVERVGGCDRARFQEARERLFPRLFGAEFTVHRDVVSAPFPVDVIAFAPGHGGRDFFTLVTSGMSDRAMAVPADDPVAARRAELVLYLDSPPGPAVLRLLRTVATMPLSTGFLGAVFCVVATVRISCTTPQSIHLTWGCATGLGAGAGSGSTRLGVLTQALRSNNTRNSRRCIGFLVCLAIIGHRKTLE